jgi:hypothetical protein
MQVPPALLGKPFDASLAGAFLAHAQALIVHCCKGPGTDAAAAAAAAAADVASASVPPIYGKCQAVSVRQATPKEEEEAPNQPGPKLIVPGR